MELRNQTELEFTCINSERQRVYSWANGGSVVINLPEWLNVSQSGGHRILDSRGVSHYIPCGWIHLSWRPCDEENGPHFVK